MVSLTQSQEVLVLVYMFCLHLFKKGEKYMYWQVFFQRIAWEIDVLDDQGGDG